MTPNNRIAAGGINLISDKPTEYVANGETVKISPVIVRNYLTSGGGNVTDQEVVMFINLCRFQHLNPFLREAYLVKYGNSPATIVTGKDAFTKRACRHPRYKGQQAGVIVMDKETGQIENRIGSMVLPHETVVGGWAKVFVEGYEVPNEITVGFDEYAGRKNNGELNTQWASKPGTMIRKVALVQALRESFPEELGALYTEDEMGMQVESQPIPQPVTEQPQEPVQQLPEDYSQIPPDFDEPQMDDLPPDFE